MTWNSIVKNLLRIESKGFTLLELLVTTIIITILSSAVFINYRNTSEQFTLQRATNKLTQDLRRMQEMALSSSECEKCNPVAVPLHGYGLRLETSALPGGDESKYIIFAHNDPDDENFFYNPSYDTIIETVSLEHNVIIYEINNGENPHVSVNIRPPDATMGIVCLICGKELQEIEIKLALKDDTSKTKTIYVNAVGLIYAK